MNPADFNPRTPCGVRLIFNFKDYLWNEFQSTHPLRGATTSSHPLRRRMSNFNPRTPCGVRLHCGCYPRGHLRHFNPRTPCGVRRGTISLAVKYIKFQSTHPLRGATGKVKRSQKQAYISIHAPLAGCDPSPNPPAAARHYFNPRTPCGVRLRLTRLSDQRLNFNPRTPCGVRHSSPSSNPLYIAFQSTHPLRGATRSTSSCSLPSSISIHAPLAGCDQNNRCKVRISLYFNPRTPCGVRPARYDRYDLLPYFNPRTPCGVRLLLLWTDFSGFLISIHAPLAGCDQAYAVVSV